MKHRWIAAAALGFIFGLAAQAAPDDRANKCIDDCGFFDKPSDRELCFEKCLRQARSLYGAIAYGAQSTAAGWAFDQGTAGDAHRLALSNCTQHGDDCKVVVSFSNSCAAVAAGTNKRFATGQASNREQAQANAVAACGREGGAQCAIQAWSCARP